MHGLIEAYIHTHTHTHTHTHLCVQEKKITCLSIKIPILRKWAKKYCCCCYYESLGPVWYMCLKTENCCLKIFMEIRVGEKVR